MSKVNKDQQLVDQIYIRYGVDVTALSDNQVVELMRALEQVLDMEDRDELDMPTADLVGGDDIEEDEELEELNFEDEDEPINNNLDIDMEGDEEGENY